MEQKSTENDYNAIRTRPSFVWESLKDFSIIIATLFVFYFCKAAAFLGLDYLLVFPRFLAPIIDAMSNAVPCFIIFYMSIRLAKSPITFFALSAGWAIWSFQNILSGAGYNLDLRVVHDVYIDGEITPYGIIYKSVSAPNALLIFAIILLSSDVIRKYVFPAIDASRVKR
jgi:hypothetical protein